MSRRMIITLYILLIVFLLIMVVCFYGYILSNMFRFCELSDLTDLSDMLLVIDLQYSGSVLQAAEAVLDSGICGGDSELGVQFHVEGVQHICH